jgi:hypothetical protein
MMDQLLESIRAAVSGGASPEQKAAGAQACRAILAALEAEAGKPIPVPGAPAASPLGAIDPTQALDLLIARLRAALPAEGGDSQGTAAPAPPGLRISLVSPPPGVPWKRR